MTDEFSDRMKGFIDAMQTIVLTSESCNHGCHAACSGYLDKGVACRCQHHAEDRKFRIRLGWTLALFAIGLLTAALCGCASQIPTRLALADGSVVDCVSAEARTSMLGNQLITACTPSKGLVAVYPGTSTGGAVANVGSSAVLASGIAVAGATLNAGVSLPKGIGH